MEEMCVVDVDNTVSEIIPKYTFNLQGLQQLSVVTVLPSDVV